MATVDTIGKVRRAYFVQKHSIKQIAREQRLARNTVRSIVCAPGETERCYERRAQPSLRLGVFVPALDAMLAANAAAPKRERLTFLRLFGVGTNRSRATQELRCEVACRRAPLPQPIAQFQCS